MAPRVDAEPDKHPSRPDGTGLVLLAGAGLGDAAHALATDAARRRTARLGRPPQEAGRGQAPGQVRPYARPATGEGTVPYKGGTLLPRPLEAEVFPVVRRRRLRRAGRVAPALVGPKGRRRGGHVVRRVPPQALRGRDTDGGRVEVGLHETDAGHTLLDGVATVVQTPGRAAGLGAPLVRHLHVAHAPDATADEVAARPAGLRRGRVVGTGAVTDVHVVLGDVPYAVRVTRVDTPAVDKPDGVVRRVVFRSPPPTPGAVPRSPARAPVFPTSSSTFPRPSSLIFTEWESRRIAAVEGASPSGTARPVKVTFTYFERKGQTVSERETLSTVTPRY